MCGSRRQVVGARGERLAERHLAGSGYRILDRNFRTRFGELDLIAAGAGCLVFCEVKTRVEGTAGGPAGPFDAIGPRKRRQLRLMAREWLASRARHDRPPTAGVRFDAIGVTLRPGGELLRLEHLEDAF